MSRLLRLISVPAIALITSTSDYWVTAQSSAAAMDSNSGLSKVNVILAEPARITRTIPSNFLGINYTAFWDPAQGSRASARALAQTRIRSVRFPGGSPGNWYDWQQPYFEHRTSTSPKQLWHYAQSFGAKHVLFQANASMIQRVPKPPGKSYEANTPENAAAWVSYNKKVGIHADMEVGNEADSVLLQSKDDPQYATYIARFNAQATAMHQANHRVRVLGPVGTNEWYWSKLDGLGMFLRGAGNRTGSGQVDGISLHFYQGNDWSDSMSVPQYWLSSNGPWMAIQNAIRANDSRKLPVYISEWNLGGKDAGNKFTPTLGHGLVVADMIGAFAVSGVAGADYFDTHRADGWGLLYGADESRPIDSPTPAYYAMALWRHMGNRVVFSQQSDDASSVMASYVTSRTDGSVQALVVNKRPAARMVRIELQRATPAGHRLRVYSLEGTAGSVGDLTARYNGVVMPSPQRPLPSPRDLGTVHGNTISYRIPGFSAVVLDISGTTPAPRLRWGHLPPSSAAPPIGVNITGGVTHGTIKAGETQTLTAAVQSSEDLGPVIIDLEVYDDGDQQVFQATRTVRLLTGTSATAIQHFVVPVTAQSGTYHLKVGVFGLGWTPKYAWVNDAGSFTVEGSPRPEISVAGRVDPSSIGVGALATFTAEVSATRNVLNNALVDFELYDSSGNKVWSTSKEGVTVPMDQSVRVLAQWAVPTTQLSGTYTLKLGVFGPNWKRLYTWNDKAATLTIGSP